MGIIKHLGRTVNSGSAFTPAVPTSRTFYFSEGSNGAALNENVIWYVDGASTNDQYPYTYNATAEFTAELRFQNGYTISSANDVVLSNDFSDPQYEWSISKSLNAGGDILTLTFTPDADDFNGNPVTITVDENNTVVIDPTPPYDQYDPTSLGFSADGRIDGFYKNGPVYYSGVSTPIPYAQLYGRNDTLTEGSSFDESKIHRFFSELDSNGLPTIGSYARGYGGMLTTEGYDINISSNFGTSNVSEDGTVFKFKNVIRYEVAPNGYSYVAEIIDEIISEPSSAPEYDGVAILQIKDGAFGGSTKFDTTPESNYTYAAETGANVITFRHQMNLYLGDAREYITEVHISSDGSDWDIYNIASFDSNSIYIEGTFTGNIGADPYVRFKFEGDVTFAGFMLNFNNYITVADLRSIASGNSIQSTSFQANDLFNNTGEYSYQQFVGKKMQLVNDAGDAVDMIYEISEVEVEEHATQATSNKHITYMSPSYVPFSPNTYKYFKFPTTTTTSTTTLPAGWISQAPGTFNFGEDLDAYSNRGQVWMRKDSNNLGAGNPIDFSSDPESTLGNLMLYFTNSDVGGQLGYTHFESAHSEPYYLCIYKDADNYAVIDVTAISQGGTPTSYLQLQWDYVRGKGSVGGELEAIGFVETDFGSQP